VFFKSFLFPLFTITTKEEKGSCGHTLSTVRLPKDYNIRPPQYGNQRKQKKVLKTLDK